MSLRVSRTPTQPVSRLLKEPKKPAKQPTTEELVERLEALEEVHGELIQRFNLLTENYSRLEDSVENKINNIIGEGDRLARMENKLGQLVDIVYAHERHIYSWDADMGELLDAHKQHMKDL